MVVVLMCMVAGVLVDRLLELSRAREDQAPN